MTQLAIMTRDFTSYFMPPSPIVTREAYETDKTWHLKPGSSMYGAVLVEMKNKPDGWTFTMGFSKSRFSWRPMMVWLRPRAFLWLGMTFIMERDYQQVPGRVIADHLGARLAEETRDAI